MLEGRRRCIKPPAGTTFFGGKKQKEVALFCGVVFVVVKKKIKGWGAMRVFQGYDDKGEMIWEDKKQEMTFVEF